MVKNTTRNNTKTKLKVEPKSELTKEQLSPWAKNRKQNKPKQEWQAKDAAGQYINVTKNPNDPKILVSKKAVIIFSGGLDSTALLYGLIKDGYKIHALTFDYGQRFKREIEVAKQIISKASTTKNPIIHKVIDLSDMAKIYETTPLIGQRKGLKFPEIRKDDANANKRAKESMEFSTIPFRNGIFLSIAVAYAQSIGSTSIWYAAHKSLLGTVFPDCTEEFVEVFQIAAATGTDIDEMKILAPFISMTKDQIISYCSDKLTSKNLRVPLEETYSCYAGTTLNCGVCNNCVPRIKAFQLAGVDDKTNYESDKSKVKAKAKVRTRTNRKW